MARRLTTTLLAVLWAWTTTSMADPGPPQRVVTLAPHITEMVFAAGAGHTLVGTVVSSNYPDAARELPKVGDGAMHVSAEALIRLKPDLVLAWHEAGPTESIAPFLKRLDIPLEFLAPSTLDDIPEQIEQLGRRLGTTPIAEQTAATMRNELRTLRQRYAGRPALRVFIEVGVMPLYAAGNDTLLNDALHTCAAVNVFEKSRLAALPVGPEHILRENPQVILVAGASRAQEDGARQRWAALGLTPAHGTEIHGIDPDVFFRPGPRLIDATNSLCQWLESRRTAAP